MTELTLESLAARLAAVESELVELKTKTPPPLQHQTTDWRHTVGMFDNDPGFHQEVLVEAQAIREAEREAARRGEPE